MLETSKMDYFMGKVLWNIIMGTNMMDNGKMEKNTEKVSTLILMKIIIMVIG